MHVASSYYYDVEPCLKAKVPVIWVNRAGETLDAGAKKPTAEVKTLLEAAKLLGAATSTASCAPSGCTRTSSSSSRARTRRPARSCARGGEAFCIDSPVFPDELEILPAIAEQAGFGVVGAARHARRLGSPARRATPSRRRRSARPETTAARLVNEPGAAQRELRDVRRRALRRAPEAAVAARRPAAAGARAVGVGERELELHPSDGHTADGMAIWVPWARVLVAGDYLSPVEIPMLSTRRLGRAPTWRRCGGWSRWSSRPTTSCPATAGRSTASARRRSCARTAPTSRRCSRTPDAAEPAARPPLGRAEAHPRGERRARAAATR